MIKIAVSIHSISSLTKVPLAFEFEYTKAGLFAPVSMSEQPPPFVEYINGGLFEYTNLVHYDIGYSPKRNCALQG